MLLRLHLKQVKDVTGSLFLIKSIVTESFNCIILCRDEKHFRDNLVQPFYFKNEKNKA